MGIMLYESGQNKPGNASVLKNRAWSSEAGRAKKGQPVSLGQVQLMPLASSWMGPRGSVFPRITGLGCGGLVAVAPHLEGMGNPLLNNPFGIASSLASLIAQKTWMPDNMPFIYTNNLLTFKCIRFNFHWYEHVILGQFREMKCPNVH